MAINVPMESLAKVIYKGTELNEFSAAGCTWRKPCTLSINSENWDAISYLELERSPVPNTVNALAAAGWDVLEFQDAQTAPVVYGDTIYWTVEAAAGWNAPRMTARGNVSSYEEDGGDASGNSGRFMAAGDCEAYLSGATRRTCTVTINVSSSGIERWGLTADQPDGTQIYLRSGKNTVQYGSIISGEYETRAGYVLVPYGVTRVQPDDITVKSNTTINITTASTISAPVYVSQSSTGTQRSVTLKNNNSFTVSAVVKWECYLNSGWSPIAGADTTTKSVAPFGTVTYKASNGNQVRFTATFTADGQLTSTDYITTFSAYTDDQT